MTTPMDNGRPVAGSFRWFWNHPIVIAGVMGMLLLLVTAVSVIAVRGIGRSAAGPPNGGRPILAESGPGNTPGSTPDSDRPEGTSTAGASPAGGGSSAAPRPEVFLSGKLEMAASYNNDADLDTAKKNSLAETEKFDLQVSGTAINAVNRAQLALWSGGGAPTPAGCGAAGLPWGATAHLSVLTVGASVCVRTSDERLGAITVAKVTKNDSGRIETIHIDYVVWKKTGDQ